jgi:hypothetical protein
MNLAKLGFRRRGYHAAVQLAVSALCGIVVAAIVLPRWYPSPYAALAGGAFLAIVLMSVQLVLGPVMAFILAAPGKSRRALFSDLAAVGLIQITAFSYGIWKLAEARPVYLVFEVDQFRLVTDADVDPDMLRGAAREFQTLSWTGPLLISTKKPTEAGELMKSIDMALAGVDLGMQPQHWVPYDARAAAATWKAAVSIESLREADPTVGPALDRLTAAVGGDVSALRAIPVVARRARWVAIITPPASQILEQMPSKAFP